MDKNLPNIENYKQNFNFLTEIYEVMKSFENNPSKLAPKINELKTKFEKARALLENIPGIDMSLSEQQEYYQKLLNQYKKENEMLNSYKEMCNFDLSKLDQNQDLMNGIKANKTDISHQDQSSLSLNPQAYQNIFNTDLNLDDFN